jgi:4-amino-4-deoxy-L-arabinose transferase-like glycosyltransferase
MRNSSPPLQLNKRALLLGVLIVLFAFALRIIVIADRAALDPEFYTLPLGSDQRMYLNQVIDLEAGLFPNAPFAYQPGIVYYLAAIRAIVGPEIVLTRLVMALFGALACGLMVGIGWLLTRREWGGYFAGLFLALYPVANFYASSFLIEGAATVYVTLFVFLVLWQGEGLSLWRSVLIGVMLGLLAITRSNLMLLALAWAAYVLSLRPGVKAILTHGALSAVFMTLTIAPVTLWNIHAGNGAFQLIARTGADQIYVASNRDASGIPEQTMAWSLAEENEHLTALFHDIQRDPVRFIAVQIRKAGLFWNAAEPGNNLNYLHDGEAYSPLLRAIPLDFRILAITGWLGMVALYFRGNRSAFVFMLMTILLMFLSVMLVWIASRIRFPIVIPLIASSSVLAVTVVEMLQKQQWRGILRRFAVPAVILAGLLAFGDWAIDALPMKHPLTAVPEDVRRLDVTFNEELRLIGWRPVPGHPAAQERWSERWRHYAVELFWEVTQPTQTNYESYIAYIADEARYTGRDYAIGTVSYPPRPTSQWQPGEIYSEIVGFKLQDMPYERSGEIRLGVYYVEGDWTPTQDNRQVFNVVATSLPDQPGAITLHHLAIYDRYQPAPPYAGEGYDPMGYRFDENLLLHGSRITRTPNQLQLDFYWEALASIPQDYTRFVHVVDQAGTLHSQHDGPPRDGALLTSGWMPNYPLTDRVNVDLPTASGTYRVYMGLYNAETGQRASVEAPDNRVLLGEFTVR